MLVSDWGWSALSTANQGRTLDKDKLSPGRALLFLGAFAFSATLGAMIALLIVVTPVHAAGGPILSKFVEPVMGFFRSHIPGGETLAGAEEDTPVDLTETSEPWQPRFVVRFEDAAPAMQMLRAYKEDRRQGRQDFAEWSRETETFRGFVLEGISTSGEAILSYRQTGLTIANQNMLRDLTRRLTDAPDVAYADAYQYGEARS